MAETMWTFETANLRVAWIISPDSDVDTSFDESGETQRNLDSGLWVAFESDIVVTHKATGARLGSSSLCGSIYENPADFRDHIGRNAKGYGSYFSDMVREACREARKALRDMKATPVREA